MSTTEMPTHASPFVYGLMQRVFKLIAFFLLKQRVIGLENIPKQGAYLLVMNHLSIWDPPIVFMHTPRRMIVFVADKWRKNALIAWVVETVGAVWVARGEADMSAIKQSLNFLRGGYPMGMAPEGTRSHTGALIQGKTGAAYLADRAGVPIVPTVVYGTESVTQNLKRLRRTETIMKVGEPFRLPQNGRAKAADLEQYTDQIMIAIARLLPPQYHGVYADHPLLKETPASEADTPQ